MLNVINAERHKFPFMLGVVMLNVVMLSVIMLNVVKLNVMEQLIPPTSEKSMENNDVIKRMRLKHGSLTELEGSVQLTSSLR